MPIMGQYVMLTGMGEYKHLDKPMEQRQAVVNLFVNRAGENLRRKKPLLYSF